MDGGMDGGVATRDAGASPDAGPECEPVAELCNRIDDDCDELVDEDFDLSADLAHCGACDMPCPAEPPNGLPQCGDGRCAVACDPGFADCDGLPGNGCEASLLDPETCGECTTACPDGSPLCEDLGDGPVCVVACGTAATRCATSCVNISTDPRHCGRCGGACVGPPNAAATCGEGICGFVCDPGFADCDRVADNGCEASLSSPGHCGACDAACALTAAISGCVDGGCVIAACVGDLLDCDGVDANGCEAVGVVAYPDDDRDGEGAASALPMHVCEIGTGFSDSNRDCDDRDARAFPGQTVFFATAAAGGGFDFDCDTRALPRWTDTRLCISGPMCMIVDPGWDIAVPGCGVAGDWVTDCTGGAPCTLASTRRTQECR